MDVLAEVRAAVRRHQLIPRREIVVVGVSGGPDSVCLLHVLLALRSEFGFAVHVAHLNHQLRGEEAEADAAFVGDLAGQWQLPCTIEARDVAGLARAEKLSLEEAARHARYAFLADVAASTGSGVVAVAHNADDQAESVLMHFLRGSGASGLRGMLPSSDLGTWLADRATHVPQSVTRSRRLIRPLLTVPRSEIEAYCREHGLRPRLDRSNLDTTFFRNRLRHELLPALETYNPNIREVLHRTADVLAAEVEVLREACESAWRACVSAATDDGITFRLAAWRGLALAMQRATLREAVRRLRPSLRNVNFVHIDDAVSLLREAQTGAQATLPRGITARVDYETFTVSQAGRESDLPDWPLLRERVGEPMRVNTPGVTPLPDSDWVLEAVVLEAGNEALPADLDRWTATFDADAVGAELGLRSRRSTDVFHPQGMPGPLRLADWMTNAKIPKVVRDRLPLMVAGDRIAWVSGFRAGQPFLVTPTTRRVVRLTFRKDVG